MLWCDMYVAEMVYMWTIMSNGRRRVSMVVADVLVPIWCQDICNNNAGVGRAVRLRGAPT